MVRENRVPYPKIFNLWRVYDRKKVKSGTLWPCAATKVISPSRSDNDVPFSGVKFSFVMSSISHLPLLFIVSSLDCLTKNKGKLDDSPNVRDILLNLPILAFRSPAIKIGQLLIFVSISSNEFSWVARVVCDGKYPVIHQHFS